MEQQHNYTCQSQLGYARMYCKIKTDEFKSSPYANGATRMDIVASYWCFCAAGFEGCSEWLAWAKLKLQIMMYKINFDPDHVLALSRFE